MSLKIRGDFSCDRKLTSFMRSADHVAKRNGISTGKIGEEKHTVTIFPGTCY